MRFSAVFAVLISSTAALQWPNLSSLLKREDITPGSPLYNCHEACGEVILISESNDYCSNSTFTTDLRSCLECALTYNIWQYYGDHVKSAASSCSDDATPSSSSAMSGTAATATATTTTTTTTTSRSSSTATGARSDSAATSTGSASATAASASASTGAAPGIQQNAVLPAMMGAVAWALL
ncbi:uncharacterized protein N7529_009921 [Penicillium soppii]|uniref:uncharacterized protein n=1 Tax=Penicillium soppii TaxID=69789 RepID=UPI002546EFD8|nr:uncharacterized protein N7529_009921 [Penicillium soppii]KAJ5855977.1 hypothetical protein N7529_009921 [Penicillium soppii]